MISPKPVPSLFNRLESYNAVNIGEVVHYLHKTTGRKVLAAQNGYYDAYTLRLTDSSGNTEYIDVLLDSTEPYFGGLRHWFVCQYCHRRVVNLYHARQTLACRHCLGLEYSSRIYGGHPLCLRYMNMQKAAQLMSTRRLSYAGKPTRAGRRLNRLVDPDTVAAMIYAAMSVRSR